MRGPRAPKRNMEAMSDIVEENERDEVFRHSVAKGVFSNIQNSPLKRKLPRNVQMYRGEQNIKRDEHENNDFAQDIFNPQGDNARRSGLSFDRSAKNMSFGRDTGMSGMNRSGMDFGRTGAFDQTAGFRDRSFNDGLQDNKLTT